MNLPLYLQIPELRNLSSMRTRVLQEQQNLLQILSNTDSFADLVLSLRYLYLPTESNDQRLKIYLCINHTQGNSQKAKSALNIFTKGCLSEFYKFQVSKSQSQDLGWVNYISEIIKYEEFIEATGYYIPYLFEANLDNDMLSVCKVLNRLDNKMMIEITLQTCQHSDKETISQVIEHEVKRVNQNNSSSYGSQVIKSKLNTVRDVYNNYLQFYVMNNSNLFKYSIKVLAENSHDIPIFLSSLIPNVLKDGRKYRELLLERSHMKFQESLKATERVELSTSVEWEGWQRNSGQLLLRDTSSNSLSFPLRLQETEPVSFDNEMLPSTGEIVRSSNSSLRKFLDSLPGSTSTSINPKDLKLLHRLVTPQEISNFFRIVVSRDIPVPGIPQEKPSFIKPTAEEIFEKYSDYIDEDRYIVGVADDGSIVCSDWSEVAHRLVAGVNGSGKTNFLNWVIFQFLYANPKRKVYILDFKGVDFQFYEKLEATKENVKIVTEIDTAKDLLEDIYSKDFQKRQQSMKDKGVSNIKQLQKSDVNAHRILVLVDEAADIAVKSKGQKQEAIEGKLQEYARKGRGFGIHLMYCTQTPKAGVISAQVTSQLDERIIFRVSEDVGDSVIGNLLAAATKIPLGARGRGRAIVRSNEGTIYVNTPRIELPESDSDSFWSKIGTKL